MRRFLRCLLLSFAGFVPDVPAAALEGIGPPAVSLPRSSPHVGTASTDSGAEETGTQPCHVEGKVTFAGKRTGRVVLELTAGGQRIHAELSENINISLPLLLHSQVRISGRCENAYTADGYRSPARISVSNIEQIEVMEFASRHWEAHAPVAIRQARAAVPRVVRMHGSIISIDTPRRWRLRDATGEVIVESLQSVTECPPGEVEVLGEWSRSSTNLVLTSAALRRSRGANDFADHRPVLRTTEEVHALKPRDAKAQYPVRILGVITSLDRNGGMVQDATRGVYVHQLKTADVSRALQVSDYVEVDGLTVQGSFAPMIVCRTARYLGPGRLPTPVQPTWERLNNGSLDCQFVEIEGFVTEAYESSLVLLMPEGHFGIALVPQADIEARAYQWPHYLNKHVRIRGTVFATRDNDTQRVRAGSIGLGNPVIGVGDPVMTLDKQIGELLQFDVRAAGFHRVRVAGQVLHARDRDYYLSDGTNSLRFVTRKAIEPTVGDLVEVSGFPRLAGGLPMLLESKVQKTGAAELPPGRTLSAEELSRAHVGALVQLEARLLGVRSNRTDLMLDLQAGSRSLVARLEHRNGSVPAISIGSRLHLTGVYAGHASDRVTGAEADTSELLLNSPAAIQIVERPSWWTPARALTVVSSLLGLIAMGGVWVVSLRRQVETRSAELKEQILGREHAERQHLLEAERSRLARDLHDELGTSLTEMSLLANVGAGTPPTLEKASERFHQIADKAVRVIDALDVIVWAVNPATDSLQPMADYITSFVREFLATAGIRCRLKVPIQFPAITLDSQVRHNLFMAVKEALNNAARHSAASEIEFEMAAVRGGLRIAITDNGVGFDMKGHGAGMGLVNLRRRLEAIGGHCTIESATGNGTSVKMFLPLPEPHPEPAGAVSIHYEPDHNHWPRGGQRHDAANAA